MKRILAGLVVAVMMAGAAVAGPLEDVTAANKRGDYATALRLLQPLAEQGNARAQTKLGAMYDEGIGVPKDYAQAMKWYRLAAEQGDAFAQYFLGFMYEQGHGVPQDYAEAVKWYRLAAEQGNAEGQIALGNLYVHGSGVPADYVLAYVWFNLAAAHGNSLSGLLRDEVATRMTPDQIAEAQRLAREWKPTGK